MGETGSHGRPRIAQADPAGRHGRMGGEGGVSEKVVGCGWRAGCGGDWQGEKQGERADTGPCSVWLTLQRHLQRGSHAESWIMWEGPPSGLLLPRVWLSCWGHLDPEEAG